MTENQLSKLRDSLTYDKLTGRFVRAVTYGRWVAGTEAGTVSRRGYIVLRLKQKNFYAHRVAWGLIHGLIPKDAQIDHMNGCRTDNRIANLRLADPTINQHNRRNPTKRSKTGVLGVGRISENTWSARITVDRKTRHLGCFSTPEIAHATYLKAKRDLHPGNLL